MPISVNLALAHKPVHVPKRVHAHVFSLPSRRVWPGYSSVIWLNLCLSFGFADLTMTAVDWPKVWSVGHHYLSLFLVCWQDWAWILVHCLFQGRGDRKLIDVPQQKAAWVLSCKLILQIKGSSATLHLKDAFTSCGFRKAFSCKNLAMYKTKQNKRYFFFFVKFVFTFIK